MPPISSEISSKVESVISSDSIVVFSKTTCPFCSKVKGLFKDKDVDVKYIELDQVPDGAEMQDYLKEKTGQGTVPNVFINGKHLGGCTDTFEAESSGKLDVMINSAGHTYDYDIIVIGGGSGGLAASKEAKRLGKTVAVCDFVVPTPIGTKWGLGGTCVNVGCIPKKLMHQAGMLGGFAKDAIEFGWETSKEKASLDWNKMVEAIQSYIGSLNWGYRVALRDKGVKYLNEYATFIDPHTIQTVDKKGKEKKISARNIIIATGGRPRYPDIPGAKEFGITSDDIFSLPNSPGKTLLVGASYISLECASFLHHMGLNTTVMVRSILLRGFDRQMADKIGDYMESEGVRFVKECVPEILEKTDDGKIKVSAKYNDGTTYEDYFDTVVFAVGRNAETSKIGIDKAGVIINPKNGKILHDDSEKTNVDHIYAIGDVLDGKPELTPVAIQAGLLLARRLCGVSAMKTNYDNVPTTVFTSLEYGSCGLGEEDAISRFGDENLEVYHKNFWPLEWTVAKRSEAVCYAKLIVLKSDGKVIGLHYLGPNAGEVTQGFAGMIAMGACKSDFDSLIGIHPTTAEVFVGMDITKSSGVDPAAAGC